MGKKYPHRRRETRQEVFDLELKANAVALHSPKEHGIELWDLSQSGLGARGRNPLKVSEFHVVSIETPELFVVPCRVAWCSIDEASGLFRIGFKAADPYEESLNELIDFLEKSKKA